MNANSRPGEQSLPLQVPLLAHNMKISMDFVIKLGTSAQELIFEYLLNEKQCLV